MALDWRARRDVNDALESWEVLAEEFEAAGGNLGSTLDEVVEQYFQAKREFDTIRDKQRDANAPALERASSAANRARKAVEEKLFAQFHASPRTALCFSGGGVRSATFGVGVLHGLAKVAPISPLPEFDYLSTVSGGGYLGAWFSAWAAREEQSTGVDGAVAVAAKLAATPTSTLDPEPEPLLHLRRYARFLNPKMGLLSADTWTLAATVARNIFLNWLILIPIIMALLVLPMFYESAINVPGINTEYLTLGLAIALLGVIVGSAYIIYRLPSFSGSPKGDDAEFIRFGLLPLWLGAILLALFWRWHEGAGLEAYRWYHFALLGAVLHICGAGLGAILLWFSHRRSLPMTALGLFVAALSGAVTGWLAYLASRLFADQSSGSSQLYACLSVPIVMLSFAVSAMLAVGFSSYITDDEDREWWSRAGGYFLIVTVGWLLFSFAVLYVPGWLSSGAQRLAALLVTGGVGGLASRLGFSGNTLAGRRTDQDTKNHRKSFGAEIVTKLAGPAFLLLLIAVLGMVDRALIDSSESWFGITNPLLRELYLFVALLLLAIASSVFINVNRFSLHAMYRARLIRTYLGASTPNREYVANRFIDFTEADNIPLSKLSANRPLHLVNIALNLVGGKNLAWQQRKAESFTASRLRTGSLRLGYQKTLNYGNSPRSDDGLTLGSAITISGAAASPNMGYHSSPLLSLVMTLFNARLGWWLANPGPHGKNAWNKAGPAPAFKPIIDEALGRTNDESKWVYLSDGGHFENLGLYEIILRRCHNIVIVDGSEDAEYTFEDLGNAVRKARIDLGIPIDFGAGMPIHGARDGRNRYCAIGKIHYDCVDGPNAPDGTILYIKACLNGGEPTDILHYASFDPAFPQQGTQQLWFDEAQFESYRRLGAHIVEKIWEARPATAAGSAIDQFIEAARAFIGPKPALKFVGWPKSSGFGGSISGAFGEVIDLAVNVRQT